MHGNYQRIRAQSEAFDSRKRALAFARAVANAEFLVPTAPGDVTAAISAHKRGWIYPCNVGGRQGYASNLTAGELASLVS